MAVSSPIDVVVAAYPDEGGAKNALHDLEEAKKSGVINIMDAAVLTKGEDDKLHISETADKGFGRGALIGGVAGAAVGLLAGPIGWAALGGGVIGGLAAKLHDGGFPDDRLRQVGEGLTPGSSALLAVVEETWVPAAERMLRETASDIVTEAVAADVAAQLDEAAAEAQEKSGG
jgi:uncharacterized membrane protein